MNEVEFVNWIDRIKTLMRIDNESEKFIEFLVNWFENMDSNEEMQLLQTYHPTLKNKSEEVIHEFIMNARYLFDTMDKDEFSLQIFDSAFFLYRPCLKVKFLSE